MFVSLIGYIALGHLWLSTACVSLSFLIEKVPNLCNGLCELIKINTTPTPPTQKERERERVTVLGTPYCTYI